jgi:hypothetical protein
MPDGSEETTKNLSQEGQSSGRYNSCVLIVEDEQNHSDIDTS